MERLFFAFWPDEITRQHLSQMSQQITVGMLGRVITTENLHITLAFIGEVSITTKQCLQQVAANLHSPCFSIHLDKLDYWPKRRILWLGVRQVPDTLSNLVTQLNTRLETCGYRPESRPYQAHVTLMRDVVLKENILLPAFTPLVWLVKDFCLMRSLLTNKGVQYQVVERWALT